MISPLISLAEQQTERLLNHGIPTVLGAGPKGEIPSLPFLGAWVVSPEKLFESSYARSFLNQWQPDLVVIDECHCVFEWGPSFRPAYSKIPSLINSMKKSLWLTATLFDAEIKRLNGLLGGNLKILGKFEIPSSLDIKTLKLAPDEKSHFLNRWLNTTKEPGIIFTPTRSLSERLSILVKELSGRNTVFYHAGLSSEEKSNILRFLKTHPHSIITATSAFGMGMDFPWLRWAILWQPLYSMLSCIQAIGRVGRSGQEGRAFLLWNESDFYFLERFLKTLEPEGKGIDQDTLQSLYRFYSRSLKSRDLSRVVRFEERRDFVDTHPICMDIPCGSLKNPS